MSGVAVPHSLRLLDFRDKTLGGLFAVTQPQQTSTTILISININVKVKSISTSTVCHTNNGLWQHW